MAGSCHRCYVFFCQPEVISKAIERNGSVFAIHDRHPVTPGHLLVIPVRYAPDFFSMTDAERRDADQLLRLLQGRIRNDDTKVAGFNVGTNCGDAAGQTIDHAHIHLIPPRMGHEQSTRRGPGRHSPDAELLTMIDAPQLQRSTLP